MWTRRSRRRGRRRAYGRIIPSGPDEILSVRKSPIGPVGAFVPWNFPAGGPMRKIAASLSAGCSIVIKPSEEVPGTVSLIARIFAEAGLPAGVLGQVCTSPSRFLVDRRVYDAFSEAFIDAMAAIKVGNGLDDGVQMGPMVGERRRAAAHRLAEEAVGRGAKVALGGEPTPGTGYFYPPTVLVDVPADAELLREEPFGPVAPIAAFDDLDEALSIANALPYGLAAYGYTDSAATLTYTTSTSRRPTPSGPSSGTRRSSA
jgi:acyl-CoA reductase-like NAD-dependent aldehyde dehydrogenase